MLSNAYNPGKVCGFFEGARDKKDVIGTIIFWQIVMLLEWLEEHCSRNINSQ